MNANATQGQFLRLCSALAVSACLAVRVFANTTPPNPPSSNPNHTNHAIPWSELGANATAQYSGDALDISATPTGARLQCVFQKLEAEVTREGLSLSSTVPDARDRLEVKVERIGRDGGQNLALEKHGTVQLINGQARYVRPMLVEEYSATVDGVRQDFIVTQPPAGAGPLRVHLALRGARAETSPDGARLMFEASGRELNYNRLRVTDATARQLAAWFEVPGKSAIQNPKSKTPFDVADESNDSQKEGKALTALPLPRAAETKSLGENDDPELGWGEGQTGSSATGPSSQSPRTLVIVVEDAGAIYPLRVDPTFSDANWISMGGIPGANGAVFAAVVDDSGNLYIGGDFTLIGDVVANGVAKWDGTNWSALGSGMGGGDAFAVSVYALAVSGNALYVGGDFTTAGGSSANYVAKWNGTTWSPLGRGVGRTDGFASFVSALAVSGSDLYVGGTFTTAGGSSANYIAKWNGNRWSALGSGMDYSVLALAVSGSEVYAGGAFTTAGTVLANRIAKWDGTNWNPLGSGVGGGDGFAVVSVYALAVSGTELYAGGYFTTAGGVPVNHIAKWNGSGWSALAAGMNDRVLALAVSGTELYAGGAFATAGGLSANRIAKWNGSSWTALGSGMNNDVFALAVSGPELYAGGAFTTAGSGSANRIAKWDGSSWSALGSGMDSYVYALAVSGSDLYAGGFFTTAGGGSANRIAKWDGSNWSALGSGINGSVLALAISDSDLFAGGWFTMAGGSPASSIAKWNGTDWTALGSGMDGGFPTLVRALAMSGTDLYAGGGFMTAGGSPASFIAKWNGSTWTGLDSGMNGEIWALVVRGRNLYAGGEFTTADGSAANYIAKWDGGAWSALGSGMNNTVHALAISGSDLYAGGHFTKVGGKVSAYLAKARIDSKANSVAASASTATIGFSGVVGYEYHVQRTTNLAAPMTWTTLTANPISPANDGSFTFIDTNAPPGTAYYRLVQH